MLSIAHQGLLGCISLGIFSNLLRFGGLYTRDKLKIPQNVPEKN